MKLKSLAAVGLFSFAVALVSAGAAQGADTLSDSPGESATMPTVLITGANRGLGLEFARQYAAAGWNVIGTARKPAQADELRALTVRVMQLDVTSQEDVDRLAADLDGQPVDLLINNAGIFPRVSAIAEVNLDDYERTLAVNIVGPARVTRAILPNLKQSQGKTIVNLTSGLGSIGENRSGGFYGYRESKAALNMLTRSLAVELGPDGFVCASIHPGWVRTDMGGPDAPLHPSESVSRMREVIENLATSDNGGYFSYEGEQVPW